uniref:Inheritance of peroxisomes protein 1 n=1 Tax=Rhabditophanes sp. KR3021 TaxID=114890 RepID=A0AC35TVV1_9BILA
MLHIRPLSFVKSALTKPQYYSTYGALGGTGFLLAIYFCEWKTVGQYIPLWNQRYPKEDNQIIESLLTEVFAYYEQGAIYEEENEDDLAQIMFKRGLEIFEETVKIVEATDHFLYPKLKDMSDKISVKLSQKSDPDVITKMNIKPATAEPINMLERNKNEIKDDIEAELIFFIPDGVKLFVIEGESATIPTYPTSLQILKFKKSVLIQDGKDEMKAEAFIQVGPWVYPLIPKKTPVLENEFNTFVVPNPVPENPNMCVGIMIPQDIDKVVKDDFVKLLKTLTEFKTNEKDATGGMTDSEKRRFSEKIALFLIGGGDKVAHGILTVAGKGTSIIQKGGEKTRSTLNTNEVPANINPLVKHSVFYIHKGSKVVAKATRGLLDAIGNVGVAVGGRVAKTISGDSPSRVTSGTFNIIGGGITGVSTVWMSLENASKILFRSIADETVESVNHKYGQDAATTAHKAVYSVGHTGLAAMQIWDLGPRSIAGRMTRKAGIQFATQLSDKRHASNLNIEEQLEKKIK